MKTVRVTRIDDPTLVNDHDIISFMQAKNFTWVSSLLTPGNRNFIFTTDKRCGPKTLFKLQDELQKLMNDDTIVLDFA